MEDIIYHEDSLEFEGSKISDVTPINSTISRAKIYVMYTGSDNAKKMHFSKDVIESAVNSAFDMPVRALYDEFATDVYGGDGDYGGHETKYDSNRGKIIRNTHPFGVVPESAAHGFEIDEDGREWFWIECYLWKTCVAYEKIEELKFAHQSTELGNISYTLDPNGSIIVNSFEFQGFCVLGTRRTPAFTNSSVSLLFEDNADFIAQFEELKAEVHKLIERTNGMLVNEQITVSNPETTDIENFEIDFKTIMDLLRAALQDAAEKNKDGRDSYIWVITASATMVVFELNGVVYGCSYEFDGTNATVDFANKKKVYQEWKYISDEEVDFPKFFYSAHVQENPADVVTFEDQNPEPVQEPDTNSDVDLKVNQLVDENTNLKRRIATEIISKYEPILGGNEQFEALKQSVENISDIDIFEKDVKCAYADMKMQEQSTKHEPSNTMVEAAINTVKPATHNARYGNLINKYSKKRDNNE